MVLFLSFFLYSVFFKYTWRFTTALMLSKIYITHCLLHTLYFFIYTLKILMIICQFQFSVIELYIFLYLHQAYTECIPTFLVVLYLPTGISQTSSCLSSVPFSLGSESTCCLFSSLLFDFSGGTGDPERIVLVFVYCLQPKVV